MSLYGSETKYKLFWLIWIASIALTFLVGAGVYFGLLELRKANSRKIGKENAVETLTYLGASYSREGGWLTIDGNFFESKPIRFSDATYILALDDSLAVKLVNCEITDEAIAAFKSMPNEIGSIQFEKCKVVKEDSPSGIIPIGNVLNEALPTEIKGSKSGEKEP